MKKSLTDKFYHRSLIIMIKNDAFNNSKIKVPFFVPDISSDDKDVVSKTMSQPLLTDGPKLREFEKLFAKFTGAKYAIGVTNATSALHLTLRSLGLGKGDEVIIPDETFVATANAILLTGATPVLADIEDDGYNISLNSIKKNFTSRTKAILPVHIAGKSCDITKIRKFANSKKILLIEDCAHAIGCKIDQKHVGTFGIAGCFSFYPTKNITTIEGGMVITNSKRLANEIITSRNHGLTRTLSQRFTKGKPWDYDVITPGYNYRMDEIRAALDINQLKRIRKLNSLRKKACMYYNSNLKNIPGIKVPTLSKLNDDVNHLYMIRIEKTYGISRDELFVKLQKLGIRTSLHYKPLHEFTAYKKLTKHHDPLKNCKQLFKEILSLPLYPSISKKEQDYVIRCISDKNI